MGQLYNKLNLLAVGGKRHLSHSVADRDVFSQPRGMHSFHPAKVCHSAVGIRTDVL